MPETRRSPPEPEVARWKPHSLRRRLLIALLAGVTAVAVVRLMLDPPGGVTSTLLAPRAPAPPQPCRDGQTSGCVGGIATVIAPAASAPR